LGLIAVELLVLFIFSRISKKKTPNITNHDWS